MPAPEETVKNHHHHHISLAQRKGLHPYLRLSFLFLPRRSLAHHLHASSTSSAKFSPRPTSSPPIVSSEGSWHCHCTMIGIVSGRSKKEEEEEEAEGYRHIALEFSFLSRPPGRRGGDNGATTRSPRAYLYFVSAADVRDVLRFGGSPPSSSPPPQLPPPVLIPLRVLAWVQ